MVLSRHLLSLILSRHILVVSRHLLLLVLSRHILSFGPYRHLLSCLDITYLLHVSAISCPVQASQISCPSRHLVSCVVISCLLSSYISYVLSFLISCPSNTLSLVLERLFSYPGFSYPLGLMFLMFNLCDNKETFESLNVESSINTRVVAALLCTPFTDRGHHKLGGWKVGDN